MNEKLRHQQKQESHSEHTQEQVQRQTSNVQEFTSVEEMLRSDAAQTEVPGGIAEKLNRSIGKEPPQDKSWWKRIFGS